MTKNRILVDLDTLGRWDVLTLWFGSQRGAAVDVAVGGVGYPFWKWSGASNSADGGWCCCTVRMSKGGGDVGEGSGGMRSAF